MLFLPEYKAFCSVIIPWQHLFKFYEKLNFKKSSEMFDRFPCFQTAWSSHQGGSGGVGDAGLGRQDARLRPRQEDHPQGGPQAPFLRQALRLPEAGGSLQTYPAPSNLV